MAHSKTATGVQALRLKTESLTDDKHFAYILSGA